MTRSAQAILVAIAAFSALTPAAHAGFTSLYTDLPADSYTVTPDITPGGEVTSASVIASLDNDTDYKVSGYVNGDPTLYLVETIKNTTGSAWNGYTISIQPDNPLVVSTVIVMTALNPAYQKFGPVSPTEVDFAVGNGWEVDYFGGTVLPGETVQFVIQFDINDIGGSFGYHIGNVPSVGAAPEPSSLCLLALGGLAVLRRHRAA